MIEKIAKNNDYIIAIKANQKSMFEGVKELFDLSAGFKPVTYHIKAESDSFLNAKQEKKELIPKLLIKVLGRIETRNYAVDTNIDWLDNKKRMEKHESVCNV